MEQKLRRKSLRNRSIHGVQAVVQRACGTQITIRQPLYFGDLYLCIGFCTAYIAFTIVYFYVSSLGSQLRSQLPRSQLSSSFFDSCFCKLS